MSDQGLHDVICSDPSHWSWSFRQVSSWQSLLMSGLGSEGILSPDTVDTSKRVPALTTQGAKSSEALTDAEKDSALADFIDLLKTREDLKDQIKSARDQEEVIRIAHDNGYRIDSLTLLRQWSQHSDFSQPTWFGWFKE